MKLIFKSTRLEERDYFNNFDKDLEGWLNGKYLYGLKYNSRDKKTKEEAKQGIIEFVEKFKKALEKEVKQQITY
jgi:hypothetical protein